MKIKQTHQKNNAIFIYGLTFSGKSTLVSKLGNVLTLSIDDNAKNDYLKINTFEELLQALEIAAQSKYDYICFDLITDLIALTRMNTLNKLGIEYESQKSYGEGWSKVANSIDLLIRTIFKLDKKIIFVTHSVQEEVKDTIGIIKFNEIPVIKDDYKRLLFGYSSIVLNIQGQANDERIIKIVNTRDESLQLDKDYTINEIIEIIK